MILEYDAFVNKLNETLFEGSSADLLSKIVSLPDRYVGIFRPTKPKTKLIQNITQSHEIKFGDALENIFEDYFRALGFEMLPKRLSARETKDNKDYDIDQLFKKGNIIYLIEQKVRDDHDSTKKRGQLKNFNDKIDAVIKRYPNKQIVAIMWFIDDALTKNKRYYEKEVDDLNKNNVNALLVYNGSFFMKLNNGQEAWTEFKNHLIKLRKEHLISVGVLDFDEDYKVHEAFCKLPSNYWAKFISGEDIYNTLRSELFTNEDSLKKIQAMMKEVKTLDEE